MVLLPETPKIFLHLKLLPVSPSGYKREKPRPEGWAPGIGKHLSPALNRRVFWGSALKVCGSFWEIRSGYERKVLELGAKHRQGSVALAACNIPLPALKLPSNQVCLT